MTCITSTHSHKNHRSRNNIKQLFFNIINLSQLYKNEISTALNLPSFSFLTLTFLHYIINTNHILLWPNQWFCSVCEHDGSFISNNLLSCTKDHVDQPSKHAHPRRLIKYCTPALGGFKYMASHVHPHKA